MFAEVADEVRVDDIFRGHFPAGHGFLELLPVLRAVDGERTEIAGRAGLGANPA